MKYKKTLFPNNGHKPTNPGRTEKPAFMLEISPNGDTKLIENGVVHTDEEIQSHVGLCDVKKIIERFTMSGELDKLTAKGAAVDLTQMPKNLAETYDILKKSKNTYDNLKPEIKQNFGSYEDFLSVFGNPHTAVAFLNKFQKSDVKEVKLNAETEQK